MPPRIKTPTSSPSRERIAQIKNQYAITRRPPIIYATMACLSRNHRSVLQMSKSQHSRFNESLKRRRQKLQFNKPIMTLAEENLSSKDQNIAKAQKMSLNRDLTTEEQNSVPDSQVVDTRERKESNPQTLVHIKNDLVDHSVPSIQVASMPTSTLNNITATNPIDLVTLPINKNKTMTFDFSSSPIEASPSPQLPLPNLDFLGGTLPATSSNMERTEPTRKPTEPQFKDFFSSDSQVGDYQSLDFEPEEEEDLGMYDLPKPPDASDSWNVFKELGDSWSWKVMCEAARMNK